MARWKWGSGEGGACPTALREAVNRAWRAGMRISVEQEQARGRLSEDVFPAARPSHIHR